MRFRYYILLFFTIVILGSFRIPHSKTTTVVFGSTGRSQTSDTLFIYGITHINDTVRKHLGNNSSSVKSILIGQPSLIIDSIDFTMFPNLEELTLSGNDDDVLQNRKYNFMEVKSLKRINIDLVYTHYPDMDTDDYTYKSKKRFRAFIHNYRPDIKVRWPRRFDYHKILWR